MQRVIMEQSSLSRPWLCPELRLHLVTPDCALWRAGQAELDALGIPDPYWAFCWPGGQALARYVLDHPERFKGKRVLDLGAGSGVCALAAARVGAGRVLAADIDPWAVAAVELNARLNQLLVEVTTEDLVASAPEGWDVILAGDMCYEAAASQRHLRWLGRAARCAEVLAADPGRGWLREGEGVHLVAEWMAPADVDNGGRYLVSTGVFRIVEAAGDDGEAQRRRGVT